MIEQVTKTIQHRRKVLVVDDEPINCQLLSFILENDYEIATASNGQECLDQLRSAPESWSLVCLDLRMPVMDGLTVLDIMAAEPQLSHIPVVVLTSEIEYEVKSLQHGAADFIKKPFDAPEIILARVNRIIELTEDRHMLEAAEHDGTGLYTQKFFMEYMEQIIHIKGEKQMDTIALDIDHFHLINEIYGHDFGDYVLEKIGDSVREFLQAHTGIGCHWNADQFYIFCDHLEDTSPLDELQTKIAALSENARLRVRAGIYTEEAEESADVIRKLSSARFACNTLRNIYDRSVAVYDAKLHDNELFAQRLINDMESGIRNHEFKVYLQPKFDITGDEPVIDSAEALVRWEHPEFGLLSPGRFIPVFEENGLLRELDRAIWRRTAGFMKRWHDEFGKDIGISVNVSRIDLYDASTRDYLLELVREFELDPGRLRLEITESAYTEDTNEILGVMARLKEDGFSIEMDDFGSGFSSLNMLTDMPLDALKLDMLFARNVENDPKKYYLVELIVALARYLGVSVISEGIETEEQYRLLKQAGCHLGQGYYFARPMPADEFERRFIC